MHRTQIYLTDEEKRCLASRAADSGISVAETVRRILDRELGIGTDTGERRAAIEASAGILSGYPDWPAWLEAIRGRSADERLTSLGL